MPPTVFVAVVTVLFTAVVAVSTACVGEGAVMVVVGVVVVVGAGGGLAAVVLTAGDGGAETVGLLVLASALTGS